MKRPEGFGGAPPASTPATSSAPSSAVPKVRRSRSAKAVSPSSEQRAARPAAPARSSEPSATTKPSRAAVPSATPPRSATRPAAAARSNARPAARSAARPNDAAARAAKNARAAERAAARARRREERAEVRRFTRRSRRRRQALTAVAAASVLLVGGVAVVTLSPLMSLDTITVVGAQRLDPVVLTDALDDHRGTPLALLDESGIRDDLAAFPLIRSYTTEVIPPHTLVVRIVERVPIAVVQRGAVVELVDAAGVVVERATERPAGIPLIAPTSADVSSLAFESVVAVLSALPADLRAQVDVISASTRDDVTFSMTGAGHRVVWGSAERSALKSRVLATAIGATSQSQAWEYDVSAPETLVVRGL